MTATYKCPKCNGTGVIGHFIHIESGVCFLCGGSGNVAKLPKGSVQIDEITANTELIASKVLSMLLTEKRVENNGIYYMKSEVFPDTFICGNEYGDSGQTLLGFKLHIQRNNFTI